MSKKILFHVYSAGRVLRGEFSSRFEALRFRDKNNRTLRPEERSWWIGPGRDHWRSKVSDAVPMRDVERDVGFRDLYEAAPIIIP